MRTVLARLAPTLVLALAAAPAAAQHAKLSPFVEVRVEDDQARVRLAGEPEEAWYELLSIDGLAADEILAHCERTYGDRAEKRFAEDLVEVLAGMGRAYAEGAAVDLVLAGADGERVERAGVPMTAENRRSVWERLRAERAVVRRVERAHAKRPERAYAALADALAWDGWSGAPRLTHAGASADLDQLEWHVEHEYSYRDLAGVDVHAAFDAVRLSIDEDGIARPAFALQVAKLLALFGDGHARLREPESAYLPPGWLPFLLDDARGGVVAYRADRSGFVDPQRPFVVALDGLPIERWLEVAARLAPQGSGVLVRRLALRNLRHLAWARLELGRPAAGAVRVELRDADGGTAEHELALGSRKPIYGSWPRSQSRRIGADVGYLRIAAMDDEDDFVRGLVEALESMRDTDGLVIDVRGNGGGSRTLLRELFPYFLGPDEPPHVANVAAYRLRAGDDAHEREGFLGNRFLFPGRSRAWTDAERAAIERAERRFEPDWELPRGDFSAWHWMVLARPDDAPEPYAGEVVVLQDGGCYSATDVFLGAFAGRPRVTRMGTTSGGGSGRSATVRLAHSAIELQLSTMASFRPTGERYDGRGVAPDVVVEPLASDFVGTSDTVLDSVLDAALARLRR